MQTMPPYLHAAVAADGVVATLLVRITPIGCIHYEVCVHQC